MFFFFNKRHSTLYALAALNIRHSSIVKKWRSCNSQLRTMYNIQKETKDMTKYYQELLSKNIQILVYNGDLDMACNFLGDQWFVKSLNASVIKEKRRWYIKVSLFI